MEYDENDTIKSFFNRTIKNLNKYKRNHQKDSKKYPYDVTQTINSFLGIIVLMQQHSRIKYENIRISNIIKKAHDGHKAKDKNVDIFFRHLRNSLAHGHFLSDQYTKDGEITALKFQDFALNGDLTFEVILSIKDMKKIISETITSISNTGERA